MARRTSVAPDRAARRGGIVIGRLLAGALPGLAAVPADAAAVGDPVPITPVDSLRPLSASVVLDVAGSRGTSA